VKGSIYLTSMMVLLSCGDKEPEDSGEVASGPTFYQDVLPLIGENCQGCHNSDLPMGQAFPLESYAHVAPYAETLLAKMQPEGDPGSSPYFMPPIYARDTPECSPWLPWKGAYAASQDEVDLFQAWIDAGKLEGDPDAPASFVRPTVPILEGATGKLSFKGSYEVPKPTGGSYDTIACFALQDGDGTVEFAEDTWLDGFEFLAGNDKVVHHVLIYTVLGLQTHLSGGLASDTSNNSWACSGGVSRADGEYSVGGYNLIYGWVPGSLPLSLQDGMAMRVPQATGLVAQVHYNTLSAAADTADRTDLSRLSIRATGTPSREAYVYLFGVAGAGDSSAVDDPPFLVPEGEKDHVESYTEVLPSALDDLDMRVWGFVPHMHLAGTEIKLERTRKDGTRDCFIHVPRWDYNWQQFYVYDGDFEDLPRLKGEDSLKVICTLDNTDDNPFLQEYLGGAVAGGVTLGDSTEEEMCLVAVGLVCDGLCPE
jgi:hypothetical protein